MKKIIFLLLTILIGTVIGLLLAEGLVRLFMPNPGTVKVVGDLRQNERFLDTPQIPAPKTGQLRITFLGDSYVYGQGVEFMEIFSNQTGERLRKHWPERKIEILNFGRPGANTPDELYIFKNNVLKYDPDLVVLGFVLNDFTYSKASWNFSQIYKSEKDKYLIFKRFENFSRLAYFLDWTIFQLFSDMNRIHTEYLSNLYNPGKNPKYQEMNVALDELLRQLSKRRGIVLFFPMLVKNEKNLPFYRTARKLLNRSCQKNQVAFIEMLDYLQDRAPSYWWASVEDHHPNAAAHAVIARVLSDFIIQQKLF